MTTHARHDRNLVRTAVLGAVLFLGSVTGGQVSAAPLLSDHSAGGGNAPVAAAWELLHPGQTANERSIALIEGSDPANFPVVIADDPEFQPPTASERSIALIESKEAPGGILAGSPAPPARIPYEESEHAVAQNRGTVANQAPPLRIPYEESEHAVARNRGSVASQAPQATSPHQRAY